MVDAVRQDWDGFEALRLLDQFRIRTFEEFELGLSIPLFSLVQSLHGDQSFRVGGRRKELSDLAGWTVDEKNGGLLFSEVWLKVLILEFHGG